jgi:diguanylate cyclase (GGDEF)-like protein
MEALVLMGAALLAISLHAVRQLTRDLPPGANRNWWYVLGGLILLFFLGYLAFFRMKQGAPFTTPEALIAAIFFLGAVFVLLVCMLAYRTTREIRRVCILEQETITDPLLGIHNRRFLDQRLEEELLRARRHRLDLTLLMVDLDHFKRVNDTHGHPIGDRVLQHVARLLKGGLRQTDVLARFGGEEFVILLPHTPEPDAAQLAERLRAVVEETPLPLPSQGDHGGLLRMTASIGSACLQPGDRDAGTLLARADKALYLAKQGGRNRVVRCSSQEPLAVGSHPLRVLE